MCHVGSASSNGALLTFSKMVVGGTPQPSWSWRPPKHGVQSFRTVLRLVLSSVKKDGLFSQSRSLKLRDSTVTVFVLTEGYMRGPWHLSHCSFPCFWNTSFKSWISIQGFTSCLRIRMAWSRFAEYKKWTPRNIIHNSQTGSTFLNKKPCCWPASFHLHSRI